jgi:HEAT repeat protein
LIQAVGNCGSDAKEAIPMLRARLDSTNTHVRLTAAVALLQIDPGYPQAVTILSDALQSTNNANLQRDAAWALTDIDSANATIIPLLLGAAKSPVDEVAARALGTLEKFAPELAMSAWLAKMDTPQTNVRLWAAAGILRIDPKHAGALAALIEGLKDTQWRGYAISCLGDASPDAKQVIAALQNIAKSDPARTVRKLAQQSLENIKRRSSESKPSLKQ